LRLRLHLLRRFHLLQWSQDVRYFAKEIEREHRNPYHLTLKAEFDAELVGLETRIPSMKNYEVVVGLQRLAALIGDGHTFVDTSKLYHRLPMEVFWFGDDLRVVRAAPEYKEAIGTTIVKVDSTPITEVRRKLNQLIPQGENEWYVMDKSAALITQVEPLAALGLFPFPIQSSLLLNAIPAADSHFTFEPIRRDRVVRSLRLTIGFHTPSSIPTHRFGLPICRIRRRYM
jgi:hypothetical protein